MNFSRAGCVTPWPGIKWTGLCRSSVFTSRPKCDKILCEVPLNLIFVQLRKWKPIFLAGSIHELWSKRQFGIQDTLQCRATSTRCFLWNNPKPQVTFVAAVCACWTPSLYSLPDEVKGNFAILNSNGSSHMWSHQKEETQRLTGQREELISHTCCSMWVNEVAVN